MLGRGGKWGRRGKKKKKNVVWWGGSSFYSLVVPKDLAFFLSYLRMYSHYILLSCNNTGYKNTSQELNSSFLLLLLLRRERTQLRLMLGTADSA